MRVIHCEQKSPEWWKCRRGVPTASAFDQILTPTKMIASSSQDKYIHKLIGERFSSRYPDEGGYVSPSMEHGTRNEDLARSYYEVSADVDVEQVGFCFHDSGRYGCSPDGIVGEHGILEIKCPDIDTQARYLLDGVLPVEYRCQVHGELLVTGREWCDFLSWSQDLPSLLIRVTPNEFTKKLGEELEKFCDKYAVSMSTIERLRDK